MAQSEAGSPTRLGLARSRRTAAKGGGLPVGPRTVPRPKASHGAVRRPAAYCPVSGLPSPVQSRHSTLGSGQYPLRGVRRAA